MNNHSDILNSVDKINTLYDKLGYLDLYGSSVFLFILITLFVILVYTYFTVMINAEMIKKDWLNQRCNPKVMPFAGFINKPDNKGIVEFTSENFNYCVQDILVNITGYAVQPLNYLVSFLLKIFNSIRASLDSARNIVNNVRENIQNVVEDILGRILAILVPFQQIFIGLKDIMGKIQATLVSGLYTMLGAYYAMEALMGAILEFVIIILIALAAIILALWILPFTWPVATTMTLVFIGIAIPLSIIVIFMTEVLHIQTRGIPGVPSRPSCFDKSTLLRMNDGSFEAIEDIQVGDILEQNNKVTAKLKLNSKYANMYNINGVVVSHTHTVKYKDKWIRVDFHPDGKQLMNYREPYLYCLNTTLKKIVINNTEFVDWDELYNANLTKIVKSLNCSKEDIHKYMDKGFTEGTLINIFCDNTIKSIPIEKIQIGDKIYSENDTEDEVYGIVELGTLDIYHDPFKQVLNESIYSFNNSIDLDKSPKLYHLLTYSNKFTIGEKVFDDYNSLIDLNL